MNQAFLVVALLPLALAGSLAGTRSGGRSPSRASPSSLLGAWATTNLWRYDDLAVVRGGQASFPLFRAFAVDHIVDPTTGRRRGSSPPLVERELLPEEPYRSYGVDLETFFARGSPRLHEDLIVLSDRHYGWDSDYELLGRVARESVRAHPGTFARNVLGELWEELSQPLFAGRVDEPAAVSAGPARSLAATAPALPEPTEGEVVPSEHQSAQLSTPDGSIREVWSSPTEHVLEFDDPAKRARWLANDGREAELFAAFPDRWSSPWLGLQMDRSSKLYPPLWSWLLVGVVAVAIRRPWRWWATLAPAAGALAMLLVTVMTVWAEPAYAVPVAPAFVLLAAVGLLGERRPGRDEHEQDREQQPVAREQVGRLGHAALVDVVAVELGEPERAWRRGRPRGGRSQRGRGARRRAGRTAAARAGTAARARDRGRAARRPPSRRRARAARGRAAAATRRPRRRRRRRLRRLRPESRGPSRACP